MYIYKIQHIIESHKMYIKSDLCIFSHQILCAFMISQYNKFKTENLSF